MPKPTTQTSRTSTRNSTKAVAEWRDKHRLREDDAVMLLVELFRIHQRHWDELRRREIPSFEQFRADITQARRRGADISKTVIGLAGSAAKPATGSPCRENHPRRRDLRRACRLAGRLSHREGMAMKLHLIPFGPIIPPPDLMLALRHPQYFLAAGGILAGAHRSLALVRSSQSAKAASRDSAV